MRGWLAILGVCGALLGLYDLPARLTGRASEPLTPWQLAEHGWPEGFARVQIESLGRAQCSQNWRKDHLHRHVINDQALSFALESFRSDPLPSVPAVIEGYVDVLSDRRLNYDHSAPLRLFRAGPQPGLLIWAFWLLACLAWTVPWLATHWRRPTAPSVPVYLPTSRLRPEFQALTLAWLMSGHWAVGLAYVLDRIGGSGPVPSEVEPVILLALVGWGAVGPFHVYASTERRLSPDGVHFAHWLTGQHLFFRWDQISLRVDSLSLQRQRFAPLVLWAFDEQGRRIGRVQSQWQSLELARRITHELSRHRLPILRANLGRGETLQFGALSLSRTELTFRRILRKPLTFPRAAIRAATREQGVVVLHLHDGTTHRLPADRIHDAWALPFLLAPA